MKYNVIYGGKIITTVDISNKEIAEYKKALSKGLPKAKLEIVRKAKERPLKEEGEPECLETNSNNTLMPMVPEVPEE